MQTLPSDGRGNFAGRLLVVHAWVTAAATWVLISIGGLVTSKGVGMAVPDWPTTYGYNMFLFPIDQWHGGIFHEHVHRLVASGVGMLTLVLALGIQWQQRGRGLRWAAWGAFALVCVQGVLGGKRVQLNAVDVMGIPGSLFFGVLHATTAQIFFCLVGLLALAVSWPGQTRCGRLAVPSAFRRGLLVVFGLTLVQLVVAAAMRHQHAGLAIPDFPLAYGRLYPPTDPEFLRSVNMQRMDYLHDEPVTGGQIHLQMLHRGIAVLLVVLIVGMSRRMIQARGGAEHLGRGWMVLILIQFSLGAATIWSKKAADVATAHVAVGALLLLAAAIALFLAHRASRQQTGKVAPCPSGGEYLKAPAERSLPCAG